MATVRFIGPEPHTVPLLGRDVQPDELVEVPDDLLADYTWSETNWRVEDEPAARPATGKTAGPAGRHGGEVR